MKEVKNNNPITTIDTFLSKETNGSYIVDTLSKYSKSSLSELEISNENYKFDPQKSFLKKHELSNEIYKISAKKKVPNEFFNGKYLEYLNKDISIQQRFSLNTSKSIGVISSNCKVDELLNILNNYSKAASVISEKCINAGILDSVNSVCLSSNLRYMSTKFQEIGVSMNGLTLRMNELSNSMKELSLVSLKMSPIQTNFKLDTSFFNNIGKNYSLPITYVDVATSKMPVFKDDNTTLTEERNFEYKLLKLKFKEYTKKNIVKEIRKIAKDQDVEDSKIKDFIKNIEKSLQSLLENFYIKEVEFVYEELCKQELVQLNINYYISNESLKVLRPNKYKNYLELLHKGIKAYHQDFRAFINIETDCTQLINTFFVSLIQEIEELLVLQLQENQQTAPLLIDPFHEVGFPSHIFKDSKDYLFFMELAKKATKAAQIGFYFRQMSEVENPKLIIAKPEVFRTWFQNETKLNHIELNSPIKVLRLITGKEAKLGKYELVKSMFNYNEKEKRSVA
jgi:hypothetical protein